MIEFKCEDKFYITAKAANAYCGKIFEGFDDIIGKQLKVTGIVNGVYTVKEAEKFSAGIIDTGRPRNVGIIFEEI